MTEDVAQKIRAQIASACDIAPEAIMVHATQVHAAPALGSFMYDKDFPPMPEGIEWLAGGVAHYAEFATQRIVAAAVEANTCLESARLRVGSGIEGRIQFNRRAVTNDGSVRMPGPNWPEPLGPTYYPLSRRPDRPRGRRRLYPGPIRTPHRAASAPHRTSGQRLPASGYLFGLAGCLGGRNGATPPQ